MNKLIPVLLLFTTFTAVQSYAQDNTMKHNDTTVVFKLPQVNVTEGRKWDNDETRYKYNQMKHYVESILPYLNEATVLFKELDAKIKDPNISKRERKAFVNSKEDVLRDKFEGEVKKLNETQGVLLVKLIARETGVNIYSMLNEFKNPLTAVKWQTWAKFNGFNLNRRYVPHEEPMLEHIMESLNYPLPALYGEQEHIALKNSDIYY
jgi:hypothetical protein